MLPFQHFALPPPSVTVPGHRLCLNAANGPLAMSTPPNSTLTTPAIAQTPAAAEPLVREKKGHSESSDPSESKQHIPITDPVVLAAREEADIEAGKEERRRHYLKFRPFILGGLALLILGWWISATVLPATRHRWYVTPVRSYCRC